MQRHGQKNGVIRFRCTLSGDLETGPREWRLKPGCRELVWKLQGWPMSQGSLLSGSSLGCITPPTGLWAGSLEQKIRNESNGPQPRWRPQKSGLSYKTLRRIFKETDTSFLFFLSPPWNLDPIQQITQTIVRDTFWSSSVNQFHLSSNLPGKRERWSQRRTPVHKIGQKWSGVQENNR